MADTKPPDAASLPLSTTAELNDVWARFRGGAMVHCPVDAGPLALAVDGAAGAYRFVCTDCGLASPWFESGPLGTNVRWHLQPGAQGGGVDE
ncbi:MAG TPA: hypothetical protein VGL81_09410 [Polyangiaceae bacterium]|jgi:hypothetical protein